MINFLVSVASPLQLMNALSAVHDLRGGGLPDFTSTHIFYWAGASRGKMRQAEALMQALELENSSLIPAWPSFSLGISGRRLSVTQRLPVVRAGLQGVYGARGVRAMRSSQGPEYVIGRGAWLALAFTAWPEAKPIWVDGGASSLRRDFSTLTQPAEKTALRRFARRLGERAAGVSSDGSWSLPKRTEIFSIYPEGALRLAGHPYRRNDNLLLAALFDDLPQGDARVVVSLNARGNLTSRNGRVAPEYVAFLDHCRERASGRLIYFPRGNEPSWASGMVAERWGLERVEPTFPVEMWIPKVLGSRPAMVFAGVSSAGDILERFVPVDRYWPEVT